MTFEEFLAQAAGYGPCIGLHSETPRLVSLPGFEFRAIDGRQLRTIGGLYDAFAQAWHFPPWFGRNEPALDDLMRDLDGMINDALGKPPALGYLTDIANAHLVFADEPPSAFAWLVGRAPFYRDYYRDEADPTATFALLLSAPAGQLDAVRRCWLDAGADIATVTSGSRSSDGS